MGCLSLTCTMNWLFYIINVLLVIFGIVSIRLFPIALEIASPVYCFYLCIVGSVNLIAEIFGSCGICHDNDATTKTYGSIILATLIAQVFGNFYLFEAGALRDLAVDNVNKIWLDEIQSPGAMDAIQQKYECCGKSGYEDYPAIDRYIPDSCFKSAKSRYSLYENGCTMAAKRQFRELYLYSLGENCANLVFTFIVFLFGVHLIMRCRQKQHDNDNISV